MSPMRIPAASPLPESTRRAPSSYPSQIDPTTCGIAALAVLAARAQADPGYLSRSRADVARTQKALHAISARAGLPWPQALGASPWALAGLAEKATGLHHSIVLRGPSMGRRIDEALSRGRDVLVYTGGWSAPLSGAIPRHVVLLLAHEDDDLYAVFEPSSGRVYSVSPQDFLIGAETARRALGFWKRPLLALVPDAPRN